MQKSSKKYVYFAFIWHGFFLAITVSMLDLNTVFPALITTLTSSKIIFGLLYSVMLGVPLIFNVIFSHFLRRKKHKKIYLLLGMYLRSLSFLGMAIFTYLFANTHPELALGSYFLFVFLFSISAGFAGISYSDIVAKELESKDRVKLYTIKQFFGSSGAFLGGLLIARIFSLNFLFPTNYTISLAIGFVGLLIASIGFVFLKEPESVIREDASIPLKDYIKKIPTILKRDESFKYFIIVENLTGFSVMLLPFYMAFALETFSLDSAYIGIYLIIQTVGTILSNLLWGFLATKFNAKYIVGFCIALGGLNPILALILGFTNPIAYGIIFFIMGFMISGRKIGFEPYLLDIIPLNERVEYLGIRGSLNILVVILPLIAGILIDFAGYIPIFITVTVMMILALTQLMKISDRQIDEFC
ncbi:MAG: MFS transporter [Bacilli bacterium]|nr:MFS transporter [Bacilli bacterium]MBN2877889.1 MFS transporter [Bacilli bacterium]